MLSSCGSSRQGHCQCVCVCASTSRFEQVLWKKKKSLNRLLWKGFQTPGNDWLKEDTFIQLLLTVVEKLWRVTCISAHVLNQFEAQVMLWKSTSCDKHHAAASKRKSMMDGHSASEKAEKTKKSKQEAAPSPPPLSVTLCLSVAVPLKIDCESSGTYERCDHIMDHGIGKEWQMS